MKTNYNDSKKIGLNAVLPLLFWLNLDFAPLF